MRSLLRSYKKRFHRKNIKTRKLKKGGTKKVNCCVCNKKTQLKQTLIPRVCLVKYGLRGHRICQDCWWDKKTGFAKESGTHNCPGCEKGTVLTKMNKESVIIDLTEE